MNSYHNIMRFIIVAAVLVAVGVLAYKYTRSQNCNNVEIQRSTTMNSEVAIQSIKKPITTESPECPDCL